MKRVILILTILLFAFSCSDDTTKNTENELEMIHGFVRTLENSERAGMLGDTSLNEFVVDHTFEALVYPNPIFEAGSAYLGFNLYEDGYYRVRIIPANGSSDLRDDVQNMPGVDLDDYPKITDPSATYVYEYENELYKGSHELVLKGEYFSLGFNLLVLENYSKETKEIIKITHVPVFVTKDFNE